MSMYSICNYNNLIVSEHALCIEIEINSAVLSACVRLYSRITASRRTFYAHAKTSYTKKRSTNTRYVMSSK